MAELDLDAIRERWRRECDKCRAGWVEDCACPSLDDRDDVRALVTEVERLRAGAAKVAGEIRESLAEIAKRPDVSSGEAIWEEAGYAAACRSALGYMADHGLIEAAEEVG